MAIKPSTISKGDLDRLEEKIDNLTALMQQILDKIQNATILTKEPIAPVKKQLSKKERFRKELDAMLLAFRHREELQLKFNLLLPPQKDRILRYLRTNDSSVFDGLKRNS